MKYLFLGLLVFSVALISNPSTIHAVIDETTVGLFEGRVIDPCPTTTGAATGLCIEPDSLINRLGDRTLTALAFIASFVSVFMILYSGILYITSEGEDAKIEKAKKTLIYAIIGIVVFMSSRLIQQAIKNEPTGPTTNSIL